MNDDELKKMMGEISPATELSKRRTIKAAANIFSHKKIKSGKSVRYQRVASLCLVAMAVFGGLSYTVTQSSRSGGGNAGKETNLVNSAQLTQYPSGIRTSIVRMFIEGADVSLIEFDAPSNFSTLTKTMPMSALAVFHPAGGGATYAQAPGDVMANGRQGSWVFNGENQIFNIGTSAKAATLATVEIIAFLPGISTTVCNKLNGELGLASTPLSEAGIDVTTIMGSTAHGLCNGGCGGSIGDSADVSNKLNGQPFGCFSQGDQLVYYHVLVER